MNHLLYVPILHPERETGLVSGRPQDLSQKSPETLSPLQEMWNGIRKKIEELKPKWEGLRIFQEALPVCGKEEKIILQLAEQGSLNHRLVAECLKKGAHLEGTEDPDLLIREYDLLAKIPTGGDPEEPQTYRKASDEILKERDLFIARRIRETLKDGETALLFIGIRHKVDQLLKRDYRITYIIYRIPFEAVKKVYNL